MKKQLLLLALLALIAVPSLEARRGGGRRGGGRHHGGGHRGGRHGGWGGRRHGWGGAGIGFGISVGGPRYYEPAPIAYIEDPYDHYWTNNPRANWDSYVRWLELNSGRFRRSWRSYYGRPYYRRWRRRPGVSFGVGFGF